jgi:peptidoglycan/LPS O-acetylase OafA/YrhL
VSILLVLGGHSVSTAGFPENWTTIFVWIFNGDLGVRTFFIISGFLITWLMLREAEKNGCVNLGHFYARRALRILPVYFAFLGVIGLLQWFTPFRQSGGQWVANLTFTTGLLSWGGAGAWTTGHLWSLAVEEQFYIFWPVGFVLLVLARRSRLALLLLAVPLVLAPVFRVVGYSSLVPAAISSVFSPYAFTTNFDALAIGCAGAIALFRRPDLVTRFVGSSPRVTAMLGLLLLLVPYILSGLLLLGFLTVPLGKTLQSLGLIILIGQSILLPGWGFYSVLNATLVAWVGTLSYSLYIWQQLFCSQPAWFGWSEVWWMSFPGWLAATFIVAAASYYLLESPLMRLRAKLRSA